MEVKGPRRTNPRFRRRSAKHLVVGRFPQSGQAEVFRVVHPQLHRELVLKLALKPIGDDGRSEIICDPEDPEAPPGKTREPRYPPAAKTEVLYRLNDGAGLHAFVLVASRTPLSPYREWKTQHGTAPWKKGAENPPGVVWSYDGAWLAPLTAGDPTGTRGKDAQIRGGSPVGNLAEWLRAGPGVDAVAVKAFPVPSASASGR